MTTNIFSVLNQGKTGLLSQQLAIEVTGNNIANVQTPGYTRQTVTLETSRPRQIGLGQLGTGVSVGGIERNFDKFLFNQILSEGSPTGNFSVRKDGFERIELLFNETTGRSIGSDLDEFFNSFQDIASNPTGLPERTTTLANAQNLVSNINSIGEGLFQERQNLDATIGDTIANANSLIDGIAKLNRSIHASEPVGLSQANDLRDQRDELVKSLSEIIDVTLVDENNGQVRLTLADGTPLVLGLTSFQLSTQLNGDNLGFQDILIADGGTGTINITNTIQGGELRGLLDMRDREIPAILDRFNILASGLVREVNELHRQGFGLQGSSGVDFFTTLQPTAHASVLNTGTASVNITNASPTTSSLDQYQIQFTGASSFDLVNQTTGQASGTFTFTAGSTFNLANGLAVTITGSAAAGDVVDFSVSENAAANLRVNSTIVNDVRNIAAGLNGSGDGSNATRIAALQNQLVSDGLSLVNSGSGTFTFNEFFTSLVGDIGVNTRTAQTVVQQQEGVRLQLDNRRQSISGVSVDEELINLIKFQQAFSAAARLINVVDEMFDIIQNRI